MEQNKFAHEQDLFESEYMEMENQRENQELDSFIQDVLTDASSAPRIERPGEPQVIDSTTLPTERPKQPRLATESMARDVGVGLLQLPRRVTRGVIKGTSDMVNLLSPFEDINPEELSIMPDAPAVDTVTGSAIETISEFVVGFKGVDKAFKAAKGLYQSAKGVDKAAKTGKASKKISEEAIKGALADMAVFEAQEERLSNLVQEVPGLANPVTEYLQADPDDGEAEAKFKQGIEGLALGGVTEAVFKGVKAMRAARNAKKQLENTVADSKDLTVPPLEEEAGVSLERSEFNYLGDAESDAFVISNKIDDAITETANVDPDLLQGGVLYHGTDADFKKFSKDKVGENFEQSLGVHLTNSKEEAAKYGKNIKEVKATFDNPLVIENTDVNASQILDATNRAEIVEAVVKSRREGKPIDAVIAKGKDGNTNVVVFDVDKLQTPDQKAFQINFARIQGPEDVKNLMDTMANDKDLIGSIKNATRGVRDKRTTLKAATDIDGFSSLMERRQGDAFNSDQIIAARRVYYDTTEKLMDAAKRASGPQATDIDQFNFRKLVAIHHAVQKEFLGVRAEAGRALQAWSIPVGGSGPERARAMTELLSEFGGPDTSKNLAQRIAALGNNLNTDQINTITTKAAYARGVDAVSEAWTMGLLTNPTTHIVNVGSNVMTAAHLGVERAIASFPKGSPIRLSEASAYFQGLANSQRQALANAAQAMRTGQVGFGMGKIDLPRVRATSREQLEATGIFKPLGEFAHYYGAALNRYVGGALAAGDEYSKTILYKGQLHALASREGIAKGLEGMELKKFIAETVENPTERMRADAVSFANYGTYTKELGQTGQSIQRMISRHPYLRMVAPFVRTPINIFKFTFERTPLALLSKNFREDLSTPGVRQAMAQAKLGAGAMISFTGADMAMNGVITGQGPADSKTRTALRRKGWQPYSIKLGDTYYSYARWEPLATILGMSADMSEILTNYEAYDVDAQAEVDKISTAAISAVANQVMGKTFLQGFADLTEVLNDPDRYADNFLKRYAGSIVPAGVAAIERASSPEMSYVFNEMDAIKARIPGLSKEVPTRLNIWGEPIKTFTPGELTGSETADQILSMVNPVYFSKEKDQPVDDFLLRNGFSIGMVSKRQTFEGVDIDLKEYPEAYARLVQLRGKEITPLKYNGLNMKEYFNQLFNGSSPLSISFFNDWKDAEEQQAYIDRVVKDYNDAAKQQLANEYPFILQTVEEERFRAEQINANRNRMPDLEKNLP